MTLPERLLVSWAYPRVFMVKLYSKQGCSSDSPELLQSDLRGSVTTYEMNARKVIEMIEEKTIPQDLGILSNLVLIMYVGGGRLLPSHLKTMF